MVTVETRSGRGWAYAGAILGGLVSIAANIAHSFIAPHGAPADWAPEPGAVVGAVVWPVFLFVAVEILARVRWPQGWGWQITRWGGLLPVTLVAAIVSYRHLSGLLNHYGEEPLVYLLGPLAVDGLMVMATAALMATSRNRQQTAQATTTTPATVPTYIPIPTTPAPTSPVPATPVPAIPVPVTASTTVTVDSAAPVAAAAADRVPSPAVVAARITPPKTSVAADPAPVSNPVARPVSPRTTVAATPVQPLVPSADASAVERDVAQLAIPMASPQLLARAVEEARAYRDDNGVRITAGQLARRLRVSSALAAELLASMPDTPTTAPVNGARVA